MVGSFMDHGEGEGCSATLLGVARQCFCGAVEFKQYTVEFCIFALLEEGVHAGQIDIGDHGCSVRLSSSIAAPSAECGC